MQSPLDVFAPILRGVRKPSRRMRIWYDINDLANWLLPHEWEDDSDYIWGYLENLTGLRLRGLVGDVRRMAAFIKAASAPGSRVEVVGPYILVYNPNAVRRLLADFLGEVDLASHVSSLDYAIHHSEVNDYIKVVASLLDSVNRALDTMMVNDEEDPPVVVAGVDSDTGTPYIIVPGLLGSIIAGLKPKPDLQLVRHILGFDHDLSHDDMGRALSETPACIDDNARYNYNEQDASPFEYPVPARIRVQGDLVVELCCAYKDEEDMARAVEATARTLAAAEAGLDASFQLSRILSSELEDIARKIEEHPTPMGSIAVSRLVEATVYKTLEEILDTEQVEILLPPHTIESNIQASNRFNFQKILLTLTCPEGAYNGRNATIRQCITGYRTGTCAALHGLRDPYLTQMRAHHITRTIQAGKNKIIQVEVALNQIDCIIADILYTLWYDEVKTGYMETLQRLQEQATANMSIVAVERHEVTLEGPAIDHPLTVGDDAIHKTLAAYKLLNDQRVIEILEQDDPLATLRRSKKARLATAKALSLIAGIRYGKPIIFPHKNITITHPEHGTTTLEIPKPTKSRLTTINNVQWPTQN